MFIWLSIIKTWPDLRSGRYFSLGHAIHKTQLTLAHLNQPWAVHMWTTHVPLRRPNGQPGLSSTCLEIKHESLMSQNKQFNTGSHFQNFHWKTSRLIPCESGCGPGIVMQNKWRPLALQAVTIFMILQRRCGKTKARCGDRGIPLSASRKKDFTFDLRFNPALRLLSEIVKIRNVFLLFRVHL